MSRDGWSIEMAIRQMVAEDEPVGEVSGMRLKGDDDEECHLTIWDNRIAIWITRTRGDGVRQTASFYLSPTRAIAMGEFLITWGRKRLAKRQSRRAARKSP